MQTKSPITPSPSTEELEPNLKPGRTVYVYKSREMARMLL